MKATMCLLALAVLGLLCSGCVVWRAPVVPPGGAIYTHYRAPLTGDVNKAPVSGKTGRASTRYIAYPFSRVLSIAWADASIKEAAQNGGLTRVEYADYEILQVFGVYAEFTVTVHGE
jgi:hypothetical protein